jgi:hypothetical protein
MPPKSPDRTPARAFVCQEAGMAKPETIAEIDDQIADRQLYLQAYFHGQAGKAQYYVYEIARLENLRNIVERQATP